MGNRNLLLFACLILFFIIFFMIKADNGEETHSGTFGEPMYTYLNGYPEL